MSTIRLHQTTTSTPEPSRPEHDRLERVGRRIGAHLHLHQAARWEDRLGRRFVASSRTPGAQRARAWRCSGVAAAGVRSRPTSFQPSASRRK